MSIVRVCKNDRLLVERWDMAILMVRKSDRLLGREGIWL